MVHHVLFHVDFSCWEARSLQTPMRSLSAEWSKVISFHSTGHFDLALIDYEAPSECVLGFGELCGALLPVAAVDCFFPMVSS